MDITNALYTIGAKIRTGKRTNDGDSTASKNNPYMVYLDGGYADAVDMRMLGIAYQTIADHLDELNKGLK